MNTAIETSILEHLHRLDERRKAEVLDFVEYLATKTDGTNLYVADTGNAITGTMTGNAIRRGDA